MRGPRNSTRYASTEKEITKATPRCNTKRTESTTMTTTTHYTSRPLFASDAPHVARIDAMQAEHPMGQEQIRKMVSKQHIGGLVVENSEGVIVAWCMHLRDSRTLDVVRFQRHIEFDATLPIEMLASYLTSRLGFKKVVVTLHEDEVSAALSQFGFRHIEFDNAAVVAIMEYTPCSEFF